MRDPYEQGQIHGNPDVDSLAGAIQKCYGRTNGPMDRDE